MDKVHCAITGEREYLTPMRTSANRVKVDGPQADVQGSTGNEWDLHHQVRRE